MLTFLLLVRTYIRLSTPWAPVGAHSSHLRNSTFGLPEEAAATLSITDRTQPLGRLLPPTLDPLTRTANWFGDTLVLQRWSGLMVSPFSTFPGSF